jgi:hypothetical protein
MDFFLDWIDITDENVKPAYMWNMAYIPCCCKTCFFCINWLTHGVDHWWRQRLSTNTTETCPNEQRIVIAGNPQWCRACYQQLRLEHPDWTVKRVESRCHQTRLGCSKCQVIVCETCWSSFGHDLEWKEWLVETNKNSCQDGQIFSLLNKLCLTFHTKTTTVLTPFFFNKLVLCVAWCTSWMPFLVLSLTAMVKNAKRRLVARNWTKTILGVLELGKKQS